MEKYLCMVNNFHRKGIYKYFNYCKSKEEMTYNYTNKYV